MIPPSLTRRDILKAAAIAALAPIDASAADAVTDAAKTFYYVDGYHGGIDGHMPAKSLPDVLNGLDKTDLWKVSFEIEPYSWAAFSKSDPASIERLRKFLDDPSPAARIELVSGAYGQTYAWNINGESNIRHLMYGRAEIEAIFPKVKVDTYAVQEPCWTSCLPQLLSSLGYKRAMLKNSTCWCGYHADTIDADLIHWQSPDGSSIVTVPRYANEKLVPPATEENAQPSVELIDRCLAAGIKHPSGTILQDMGWPGRPWRLGIRDEAARRMKHVTWREYVDIIATPATKTWKASQEDMRVGLAWGATVLQRIAQIVRRSENQLLQTEKLASMAKLRTGAAYPTDALLTAWKALLHSQHHDVWIVPHNRRPGGSWASEADAKCDGVDQTCRKIIADATSAMTPGAAPADAKDAPVRSVRVFNTSGFQRRDLASIELPALDDGMVYAINDASMHAVPCQSIADRKTGMTRLHFPADVPAIGYATYSVYALPKQKGEDGPVSVKSTADAIVNIETDMYSLTIDSARGGFITRLRDKILDREFIDPSAPHSLAGLRGYFPRDKAWLSSADSPAIVHIVESGPLRAIVRIEGKIGPHSYTTELTLVAGQRRINFHTHIKFPIADRNNPGITLGEEWDNSKDATRSDRRPFYDSGPKLQALFPTTLKNPRIHKNAAFDVCKSELPDTQFNSWSGLKHNIIVNWIDLLDESGSAGLAILADHTTAYSHANAEPPGLIMCYSGKGNWTDYRIEREPEISYAIVPHAGDWAQAELWREHGRWAEPLIAVASSKAFAKDDAAWSLLDASAGGYEVTTVFEHLGQMLVRIFNAEGDQTPREIVLSPTVRQVTVQELDGRPIEKLALKKRADGRMAVMLSIPRFGVRTLRLETAE